MKFKQDYMVKGFKIVVIYVFKVVGSVEKYETPKQLN